MPTIEQVLETIRTLGRMLEDVERVRVANGNRIGALERETGEALPQLYVIQQRLQEVERLSEKELARAWRQHPLAAWQKGIRGLGEKSLGRLIAEIGDPGERPNPAKLWAYCGYGDPARIKIPKNATQAELLARGNPFAKKLTWLIVRAFVMDTQSPYRPLYEEAKKKYGDRDWTDAHKDNAARRFVAKRFLRDLWQEARRLREQSEVAMT